MKSVVVNGSVKTTLSIDWCDAQPSSKEEERIEDRV
jgi:hypothetical protein